MEIDACLLNDFAISWIRVSSSSDSTLKARILFSIANLISSEVLPTPEKTIFLDDLGINLKPAKLLKITTIKVYSENQALEELESLTGINLS